MSKNVFEGIYKQSFETNEEYREYLKDNLSKTKKQRIHKKEKKKNSTINIKFSLLFVIILCSIIVTGFILSIFIAEQIKQSAINHVKNIYAIWIQNEAKHHLPNSVFTIGNYEQKEPLFAHYLEVISSPDLIRIKVWNDDGTILYSDDKEILGKNFGENERFQEAMNGKVVVEVKDPVEPENISELGYGQLMEIYVPISDNGEILGVIETYTSLDSINTAVAATDEVLFEVISISLIFIIGILIYMFVFVRKDILKPINEIKIAAEKVTHGNLDTIIPESNKKDEISRLKKSFNSMTKSIIKNIELQKELELSHQKLESKENQLKTERLTTIGELGARLAHDLRNPLSLIKNNMLIIRKKSNDPKFNGSIEVQRINDSISRMSHQIENVLDFVKDRDIELSDSNLKTIIRSAVGDKSGLVQYDFPQKDILVKCDPLLLEMVFVNIIANAVHAIENIGKIVIRIKETKENIIIEIEDSGPGIPKDVLPKIFEPLFTTKLKGTGLGLASCKNIIEKHNGTITVKNNPTTFTITLPK